ncbi:DUF4079 domain-containing protein [Synechococcus elongatus]|uniref:DUF4079 domain-containing protein n=2 Tax=Synechococcus elongatus TaxID=32046 RepID=A0AAN1QLQ3_SYNEL|nr:DUF4079 domain-containing protein [Synechococcus elongatus]AZB71573.1 DUF4079 domain-containing protein [Synechococcus elongatus PCC 11801]QFZ91020.1 DUF4079 domain-containing protein [Synechococcus elongatus PCC 11802]
MSDELKFYLNFGHPLLMWILLGVSLYAGYLGFQVRQLRSATGEEKKKLIQAKVNQKHFQFGSLVLALMVLGTVGGMAVTYINNGKLFVGPHLLAGLGMAALIAVSAALSPLMQKGSDWARGTHIALNTVIVGLFAWQAVTGMDIVQRIIARH